MFNRMYALFYAISIAMFATLSLIGFAYSKDTPSVAQNGVVKLKSVHDFTTTIDLLKKDIADKGIRFFAEIDQSQLGADAGIKLPPSTLLVFGNPPLGIQFLTANPDSGLDWPVRLLVNEDAKGQVWVNYTDFGWIARRHGIANRKAQFKMASEVIASITSRVTQR